MNIVDKIISIFSPAAAFRRIQYRIAADTMEQRRYDAAFGGNRTKNWRSQGLSANSEVGLAGAELRNRSRDLARNNPYSRKALRVIPANVIGVGIQPSIRVPRSARQAEALKMAWKDWAGYTSCDWNGRKTFYAMQRLAFRAMLESGEVFIRRMADRKGNALGLQLQVLEADHLDYTKDGVKLAGDGYIRQGIEFDSRGKRVAYYLFDTHPGESRVNFKTTSTRIPADQIIHLFYEERPGQDRGVPLGVASMLRIRDFDDYEDAQLIRQKIAACFAAFITSDAHSVTPSQAGANGGYDLERVEPGIIERLRPGESVSFGVPPTAEGYAEYSRKVLQGIGAGYDVTYEALTGDLSNVNFSSGRMGWIEFGRFVEEWQEHLVIPVLCGRVFEWFLQFARLQGIIPESSQVSVSWTAPRREFVDPLKEIKALVEQARAGFISWQEAVRMLGYDPEEIMEQLQTDSAAFDSAGLKPYSDPRYDSNRVDNNPAEELPPQNGKRHENGAVFENMKN